ncbi:MAG: hypothetical protein WHS87_02095 [Anaerolineales bacterium]
MRSSIFLLLVAVLFAACAPIPATPGVVDEPGVVGGEQPPMYTEPFTPTPMQRSQPTPPVSIPTMMPSPYDPKESDAGLLRGNAFLNSIDVLVLESYPPRYVLVLRGALPTPCHQLRIRVQPPDAEGNVYIEVYSVVDGNQICIQVLKEFEVQYPLELEAGEYTFWVNGKRIKSDG